MHESVFPRISVAKRSKEAWKTLKAAYQGMEKVKTEKIRLLRRDFETLCMKESDNIDSFFTHVIGMVTQIRKNRKIMDMVRSMLKAKHLPNDYWAEAVHCAVYILNIFPTKAVMNKVPEEA